jgi:hypothetical protein
MARKGNESAFGRLKNLLFSVLSAHPLDNPERWQPRLNSQRELRSWLEVFFAVFHLWNGPCQDPSWLVFSFASNTLELTFTSVSLPPSFPPPSPYSLAFSFT